MKISNPWPNYPMTRVTSKTPKGDIVSVMSTRGDLEVPDAASEALLEPVANGRPGAIAVAQGRIWSPEWGVQEIEDHLKKRKLVEEEKALKIKQEIDRKRRPKAEKVEKSAEKAEKSAEKAEKSAEKAEKTSK